jgi:hypothetical protein
MATALQLAPATALRAAVTAPSSLAKTTESCEFAGVFRGRELTRKDRRLASGLAPIDQLLNGGILRGRISEITGPVGAGKTSLAAAFAATVTRAGETAAWIETADNFDPESIAAAGVDSARLLWISCRQPNLVRSRRRPWLPEDDAGGIYDSARRSLAASLKAAEWILETGGFGLVVIDCAGAARAMPSSAALRLARAAERSAAAVIVLAPDRMCGTFAALSLALWRRRVCFSRPQLNGPALFDGYTIEARVARNKLGGSGSLALWRAAVDPIATTVPRTSTSFDTPTVAPAAIRRTQRMMQIGAARFSAGR